MEKNVKLSALLVASQLDLRGIKSFLEIKPLADSSSEVFYSFGPNKYQYYFNYGVIVFAGYSEDEIKFAVKAISAFQKSPKINWLRDDHEIHVINGEMRFEFDQLIVDHLDEKVIRVTMLNLAQSVALDQYHEVSENLLQEIKGFSLNLENTGKLSINRKNMLKFIGKALNTQSDIAENIYIFDAPEEAWNDEYLDKLHKGLMKHFDLRTRNSEIEYTLRIIKDNLNIFLEISHQRESNLLEWIIIVLILVEVFNLLLKELL